MKNEILKALKSEKKLSFHTLNKSWGSTWHRCVKELQKERLIYRIYDHIYPRIDIPDAKYQKLENYLKDSCPRIDGEDFLKHPSLIQGGESRIGETKMFHSKRYEREVRTECMQNIIQAFAERDFSSKIRIISTSKKYLMLSELVVYVATYERVLIPLDRWPTFLDSPEVIENFARELAFRLPEIAE